MPSENWRRTMTRARPADERFRSQERRQRAECEPIPEGMVRVFVEGYPPLDVAASPEELEVMRRVVDIVHPPSA